MCSSISEGAQSRSLVGGYAAHSTAVGTHKLLLVDSQDRTRCSFGQYALREGEVKVRQSNCS